MKLALFKKMRLLCNNLSLPLYFLVAFIKRSLCFDHIWSRLSSWWFTSSENTIVYFAVEWTIWIRHSRRLLDIIEKKSYDSDNRKWGVSQNNCTFISARLSQAQWITKNHHCLAFYFWPIHFLVHFMWPFQQIHVN